MSTVRRRKRTSLRSSFHARADHSVLHHPSMQECPNELQQPLIFDAFGDLAHQFVMIDSVEKFFPSRDRIGRAESNRSPLLNVNPELSVTLKQSTSTLRNKRNRRVIPQGRLVRQHCLLETDYRQ